MEVASILNAAQEFLYSWNNVIDVLGAMTIVGGLAYLAKYDRRTRRMLKLTRGNTVHHKKGKKEAYKRLDGVVGGKFADMLTNLQLEGVLSPEQVKHYARRTSFILDTSDAFPRSMVHEELSTEERALLQSILRSKMELMKLLKKRTKPTIPGPKPGEVDNVVVFEKTKRKFGDTIRRTATA